MYEDGATVYLWHGAEGERQPGKIRRDEHWLLRPVLLHSSFPLESWRIEVIADTVFGMVTNAREVTTFLDAAGRAMRK